MSHSTADAYPGVAGVVAAASAFVRFRPGLCTLRVAGRSREGRPLHLLTVGLDRPRVRNILVVAGPHSDERVGAASALRIAERVALDPHLHVGSGAAWHFLLCLDPDGTLRSEAGPAVRRTPADHFRHAYRPPADEQPEWAPSIRPPEDQLPESQALIRLIDELRPVLQCSLHGNDIGGSWVQLTRDLPGLSESLGKLSAERDVPVQTGTYDALYWRSSGPGVFLLPEPGERAQFDSLPEDVSRSTWIRPQAYGGMTALFEVPMWASAGVSDTSRHPDPARALADLAVLLRHQSGLARTMLAEVRQVLGASGGDPRLLRIADGLVAMGPRVAEEWDALHPSPVRLSRAHVHALDIAARRMALRAAGTLLQLLDADASPSAEAVRTACARRLARWAAELAAEHGLTWLPVPTQVDLQTEAVLSAFHHLPS
ncbi:3-hydroxyacyl-CoA dehydrogenase [Streptomyces cocklensis]|uniref:Zinc carboxypeptidase n=1 Tax=Actinacidiphila cocklensis TaxID=887465 RepID=A0A9W4GPL6_9ACTN|nr:M14 family zinc carboxypeptidase [Actinacidiphila cocklensis]MDD1061636.1 3-hydroxyacyl-CoA dehydrogenase [Actinacidiphila cocklensis]CAG6392382.1 Zinc carboxypeptidase [Actinacidiphila cocklensis]